MAGRHAQNPVLAIARLLGGGAPGKRSQVDSNLLDRVVLFPEPCLSDPAALRACLTPLLRRRVETSSYHVERTGDLMAEAREVMDRVTDAVMAGNLDELRACYADDATLLAPDAGEIKGIDPIVEYLGSFPQAFPDASWEPIAQHETGDTAIDEGYFSGTNTGPLQLSPGESIPPTGKRVRLRECDVATVSNGRITSHRFYYDQTEFGEQLGLIN